MSGLILYSRIRIGRRVTIAPRFYFGIGRRALEFIIKRKFRYE